MGASNDHPNKGPFRTCTRLVQGAGLRRIKHILNQIIHKGVRLENDTNAQRFMPDTALAIPPSKDAGIQAPQEWVQTTGNGVLLNTGGSRNSTN